MKTESHNIILHVWYSAVSSIFTLRIALKTHSINHIQNIKVHGAHNANTIHTHAIPNGIFSIGIFNAITYFPPFHSHDDCYSFTFLNADGLTEHSVKRATAHQIAIRFVPYFSVYLSLLPGNFGSNSIFTYGMYWSPVKLHKEGKLNHCLAGMILWLCQYSLKSYVCGFFCKRQLSIFSMLLSVSFSVSPLFFVYPLFWTQKNIISTVIQFLTISFPSRTWGFQSFQQFRSCVHYSVHAVTCIESLV